MSFDKNCIFADTIDIVGYSSLSEALFQRSRAFIFHNSVHICSKSFSVVLIILRGVLQRSFEDNII